MRRWRGSNLSLQLMVCTIILLAIYFLKIPSKYVLLYLFQFTVTVYAAVLAFKSQAKILSLGLGILAVADVSYCLQVYVSPRPVRDLFFVLTTSFLYCVAFLFLTFYLYSKTKKSLPLIFRQPLTLVPPIALIVTSSLFLVHPLVLGLTTEGINPDRLSAILSLVSSMPLIAVSYFAILFTHKIEHTLLPIGTFLVSIVDWAIQYEFIKYGELYFTYYDFIWCFGVILISQNIICNIHKISPYPDNNLSLRVMLKISILIAALLPICIYSYVISTPGANQIAFLLIGISSSLFISVLATHKFNKELELLGAELNAVFDQRTELSSSHNKVTDEWLNTIAIAIKRKIQLRNTEIEILEAASHERYELAKQVAHDIRSPVSILSTITKSEISSEEKNKIIESVVARITSIADGLLARHRIESRKNIGYLKPILQSIVREKSYDKILNVHPIVVHLDESSFVNQNQVQFDPQQLSIIVSNVINNSIEASASEVKIQYKKLSQSKSAIDIHDNGNGIPKNLLSKLGHTQLTHGKVHGNGLGVYNAKKALKSWGGDLMIVSDSSSYTTFRLIFQNSVS